MAKAEQFMKNRMGELIETIDNVSEHIIGEHTPNRLKKSVARISGQDRFYHTVCAPAKKMLDMKYISTSYNPVSYTHLDVYKRQALPHGCRASKLQPSPRITE